jgi:hypothetical protein
MTGSCMCDAVKLTAVVEKPHMDACHCQMCRKWAGGVAMMVECTDLKIEDETHLGVYKSSDWGERGFCKQCGSSLFWRMQDGSFQNVSAHVFEDPSQFDFTTEIYIDKKPGNYSFAQDTKKMTEAEVIAMFIGGQEQ